jgi:hypothetical protein
MPATTSGYRFGKHAAKNDYRTLRFSNYATAKLAPPPTFDVLTRVYKNLSVSSPGTLFPMDGNDKLGDCTIAALAHADTVFNGLDGKKVIPAQNAVTKLYFQLTGGVDSGLDELKVLNYWQSNSALGSKILAFVKIDPKNHTHIQQAIEIFGGVYLGFQVQENAIQEFDAHQPWTPGPLTNDGHAVFAVGYDPNTVTVLTWGNTQQGTWAWLDECVDEAYAVLPTAASNPNFAPGFNLAQLKQDLSDVAA